MHLFKLLVISIFIFAAGDCTYAQCNIKLDHKEKETKQGLANGSIQLLLTENGSRTLEVTLIRIDGSIQRMESKRVNENVDSPTKIEFKNLAEGDYVISLEQPGSCKMMVGGIDGIRINTEAE